MTETNVTAENKYVVVTLCNQYNSKNNRRPIEIRGGTNIKALNQLCSYQSGDQFSENFWIHSKILQFRTSYKIASILY
jgi:formylmethanofuran dehydrogenase subunit B